MEEKGRWVTVNGAHVFIKDGETPNFNRKLQKNVPEKYRHSEEDDIVRKSKEKIKATRDFIEKTVKEINDFESKPYDPDNPDHGISNSDLQSMVEAFGAQYGFDSDDEERVLREIRVRTGRDGTEEDRKDYERAAKINKAYWERQGLQKYNAHPMDKKIGHQYRENDHYEMQTVTINGQEKQMKLPRADIFNRGAKIKVK